MFWLNLFSSLLLGSALGKAISTYLVYWLQINFFYLSEIPSFTAELALAKTLDLIDFALTIGFSVLSFVFSHYFIKLKNKLLVVSTLIFSTIFFLQVHFAAYNLLHILIFVVAFYILMVLAPRLKVKLNDFLALDLILVANGVLVGFWLLLVINTLTTTFLPLVALFLAPVAYLLLPVRHFRSQAHLVFALSALVPNNLVLLMTVGLVSLFAILAIKRSLGLVYKYLYPIVFIILAAYNPLYSVGRLDSVEEGFWLGWISGLREGGVLYRDIAAYHPPLLAWKLKLFSDIFGYSIESVRLALHLSQIAGIVLYFFLARALLKSKASIFVVMLFALSLTTIMVKNNIEIRLGMGLLSLLFLAHPILSGAIAALSFFTSVEVGIAAVIAGGLGTIFFYRKNIIKYTVGLIAGLAPIFFVLILQGGIVEMIEQISFYVGAFASGYLNLPVDRAPTSAFIHWHLVNQYISSYAFFWELARAGIIGAALFCLYKTGEGKLEERDKLALVAALFGLIIFRSALGRSDYYHLLLPLLVALPLIFFTLERFGNKHLVLASSLFLIFVFGRNIVNASFVEAKLYQLQTYGKIVGELEPTLTSEQEEVVYYIRQNTTDADFIFVFPQNPEIYFLAERRNATRHYTPYGFYDERYQQEIISSLQSNKPKLIVYNSEMKFGNMTPETLSLVNKYILENYEESARFGDYKVLAGVE